MLLYEAKAPGTITPEEWYSGYEEAEGYFEGNAVELCKQGHKYITGVGHPECIIGDTDYLVGIRLRKRDKPLWGMSVSLTADIFVVEDRTKFLPTLIGLVLENLDEKELLN